MPGVQRGALLLRLDQPRLQPQPATAITVPWVSRSAFRTFFCWPPADHYEIVLLYLQLYDLLVHTRVTLPVAVCAGVCNNDMQAGLGQPAELLTAYQQLRRKRQELEVQHQQSVQKERCA